MTPRGAFNTEHGIVVQPMPESVHAPGVRVRMTSVGICASDLSLILHGPSPFVIGHECAGYLEDGTLAAVYPLGRCGACMHCTTGAPNRCPEVFRSTIGLGAHGGMREVLSIDPSAVVQLPGELGSDAAALVEPVAVAVHALERAQLHGGRRVLVVGAGALGLTVAALARFTGNDTTIAARHPFQRAAADRLGLGATLARDYDVVIDAAGSESALAQAADLVAPGGTVMVLGMYPSDGTGFPVQTLMMKEANVVSSTAYRVGGGHNDFLTAAHHLRDHPELADTLITHHFPLDEVATAFAVAGDRDHQAIKVLVHPG